MGPTAVSGELLVFHISPVPLQLEKRLRWPPWCLLRVWLTLAAGGTSSLGAWWARSYEGVDTGVAFGRPPRPRSSTGWNPSSSQASRASSRCPACLCLGPAVRLLSWAETMTSPSRYCPIPLPHPSTLSSLPFPAWVLLGSPVWRRKPP